VVTTAGERAGMVIDSVCPLVTKIHHEVKRAAARDFDILFVGHDGHDEAVGTIARAPDAITLVEPGARLDTFIPDDPERVALFAQTTLAFHEWQAIEAEATERYPNLMTARKSDLCYATTNRQDAVRAMSGVCDLILVVGSVNSSNTNALVRTANEENIIAHRIDSADSIRREWLTGAEVVGVTAGASAPDYLVRQVLDRLDPIEGWSLFMVTDEEEYFPLPRGLRSCVSALTSAMRLGFTARPDGLSPLDHERRVTAAEALAALRVS